MGRQNPRAAAPMILRACACTAAGMAATAALLFFGFRLADLADFNLHHF